MRYERQLILKEVGKEGQEKLSNAKVLVVGAGGLGGSLLQYLAAAGVGTIGICDNDQVSESNLHRQILFHESQVGDLKPIAARRNLLKLNSECNIIPHCERFGPVNGSQLIEKYDFIVDCSDNFETKFLINDLSFLTKKKLIQASIYQFEGQLQVFDYSVESKRPCLRCLWPQVPGKNCVGNCEEAGVLGIVAGVFGTLQCNEVIKMILNFDQLPQGVSLTIDLKTMMMRKIRWSKQINCPLCGVQANIKTAVDSLDLEDFEVTNKNDFSNVIDLRKTPEINPLTLDRSKDYLFICQRGIRSFNTVKKLRKMGYYNIFSLYGGDNVN
ncbi:MAG: ThiF family adenylyltransferase [Halobacteriovoraceae bacterium]|nr:ThiF family adenylyltransferase [Halobacteriovoraceae bacterium]